MQLKPGTRIEMHGCQAFPGFPGVAPEAATIARTRREHLPLPGDGWHIVQFSHGGKLCVHESRFRVTNNR